MTPSADPIVSDTTTALGGPPGAHAHPARRRTALVLCLAVVTAAMALGAVVRAPCAGGSWWEQQRQFADLCYSDIPHQYVDSGLAEQVPPLGDGDGRWPQPSVTPPTAVAAYVVARVSQAMFGAADPVDRNDVPVEAVRDDPRVQAEAVRHTAVAAVLLTLAALASTALLLLSSRSRSGDALAFAAAPVLVLTGLIGWDLLAVLCVSAAMWAWSRDRRLATGVWAGAGAAFALWPLVLPVAISLVALRDSRFRVALPVVAGAVLTWAAVNGAAFLLRPDAWAAYWQDWWTSTPGLGSLWRVADALGVDADATLAAQVQGIGTLLGLALVVAVVATAPGRPRVSQVALLTLVGWLLVSTAVPVQAALWVLPFAVLARPRWRDLLVWQACEAFYFCATWWHLGGYTLDGGRDVIYPLALLVRTAGLLWLAAMVVRDLHQPWQDPVRRTAATPVR